MTKIWHISDTHTYHRLLTVPEGIDMVIFSGDSSNVRDLHINEIEVRDFINWFKKLPIQHKVYVAGNHDVSVEANLVTKSDFTSVGIIYIENTYVEIEGLKLFGSPFTPTFGANWAFNRSRQKLGRFWEKVIDLDTDIIVTHGPPKFILDTGINLDHNLEHCGCSGLFKRVKKVKPKAVLFGHIHNVEEVINAGTRTLAGIDTIFSNGSVVTDNRLGVLSSNGNILNIK
jgi:Icc-related predicted phosphoesterase